MATNAKHDENHIPTAMAVTDDASLLADAMRVDPSTNRLLIRIYGTADTSPTTLRGKRDENHVPTNYGVTDDASLTLTPLIVDNATGYMFVDLLEE